MSFSAANFLITVMNQIKYSAAFNFSEPAVYEIKIQGILEKSWSDKLLGMQVTFDKSNNKETVTTLIGKIRDQAALAGILSMLYESHMFIISVKILKDE